MEIRELLNNTICTLADSGIENAAFEARQILEFSGLNRMTMLLEPKSEVSDTVSKTAEEILEKRISGYPLQYLLGEWEFYGYPFKVGEGVLIPRQDTESIVDVAVDYLKNIPQSERTVLDLCSGSGCIGITLAKVCNANVTLVEKSEKALAYLKENVKLNEAENQCKIVCADVLDTNADFGRFNVIVSNPPYLTKAEMERLQKEVRHEPEMALFGGDDGLDFYKAIIPHYSNALNSSGLFAVEVGDNMEFDVMKIFRENSFNPQVEKDAVGFGRVIYGLKEER